MNAPALAEHRAGNEGECRRARPLLGTIVEISAAGMDAPAAVDQAFRAVEEVHRLMSYHDPDSDVSRINREAALRAVPISFHTLKVLQASRRFAEASEGLFDITVAPVLVGLGYLPRHENIPKASGQGDWRHVHLLPDRHVRLARRLHIDVGGIAKGYAVDRAVEALQAHGILSGRVNAGGDLRVFGPQSQVVHTRHPTSPTVLLPLARVNDGAAATSAGYFSAQRKRGRWVTPLIHPRTRISSPHQRSVTVFARDCLTADALTKIVHADPQRALGVLAHFSAGGVLLQDDVGICRQLSFQGMPGRWQVRWWLKEEYHA